MDGFKHEFLFHAQPKVNPGGGNTLEQVVKSLQKNSVCIKGVINVPEVGRAGELLSLNQKLRNQLDLYANVVKVTSFSFKIGWEIT